MKKDHLSFIHRTLDDYDLTPQQFRVYCHVNRRAGRKGVCHAKVESIAKACGIHQRTARRSLHFLADRKLILATERPGETTEYRLNHPSDWVKNPCTLDTGVTPALRIQSTPALPVQDHPCTLDTVKVTPIEVTPLKSISIPACLDTPEFNEAWAEWIEYRKSKRKKVTLLAAKKQLADLAAMGPARAIAAINQSIKNDYQGIFEPKEINNRTSQPNHRNAGIATNPKEIGKEYAELARKRSGH